MNPNGRRIREVKELIKNKNMEKIEIAIKNIQERIDELREDEQNWSWNSSDKTRVNELLGVLEMLKELTNS